MRLKYIGKHAPSYSITSYYTFTIIDSPDKLKLSEIFTFHGSKYRVSVIEDGHYYCTQIDNGLSIGMEE